MTFEMLSWAIRIRKRMHLSSGKISVRACDNMDGRLKYVVLGVVWKNFSILSPKLVLAYVCGKYFK